MQYTPFIWPLIIAAAFSFGIALYARRFPDVPAVRPFVGMMISAAFWALIYAFSILATYEPLRIFLSMLMYIPTRLVPPFSILLVLEYGGKDRWITRRNMILLFAIPVISMIASMTSPWHTLFRFAFTMETVGSLTVLHYKGGLIYWISTIYGNGLLLASIVMMLPLFGASGLHRRNTALLFSGLFLPALLNILFSAGLTPIKGYSFAPTVLVITGICYVMALLRFRLFGVALVARSTIMENIVDLVMVFDTRDHIVDFNAAAAGVFGLNRKHFIGETADALEERFADFFRNYANRTSSTEEIELGVGSVTKTYDLTISPILDGQHRTRGRLFLFHDISDLKAAEETVKNLLEEKDIILSEVHHRIKNNMSTMAGILSLQSDCVTDPAAKSALLDARSRMQSMMVLYSKLYVTPASGNLNVELYLSPLIEKIVANFPNAASVRLVQRFEEFDLEARTLFSLGIIINEILTNAMKHAFDGKDGGIISISANKVGAKVQIEVADDGVGMPPAEDPRSMAGFGLGLVRILTTQLGGTITIDRQAGTRFTLLFTPPACRSDK
ncbi:MAG: histidine kinase N-terminal 7TM domain-containing protein [Treponemataceae bacterium]